MYVCMYVYVYVYRSVYLFQSVYLSLSIYLSVSLYLCSTPPLSLFLPLSLPPSLSISRSISLDSFLCYSLQSIFFNCFILTILVSFTGIFFFHFPLRIFTLLCKVLLCLQWSFFFFLSFVLLFLSLHSLFSPQFYQAGIFYFIFSGVWFILCIFPDSVLILYTLFCRILVFTIFLVARSTIFLSQCNLGVSVTFNVCWWRLIDGHKALRGAFSVSYCYHLCVKWH